MTGRPILLAGVALIVAQLAFRAWVVFGSWFQVDDFAFLSRVVSGPLNAHMLLDSYRGHLMPAGFFLTWVNAHISPLNFYLPATTLLLMQALASAGCLALLVHAFGERRGILVPLAVYLFSVITLPAYLWWATGINALPLQIAFFWGLYTHLSYLRTRRTRYAVYSALLVVGGLAFFEKTILVFGVFAILALAYFAEGDIVARVRTVWRRYRSGVLLYSVVAVGYLAVYVRWGLDFQPGDVNRHPLVPVLTKLVGAAYPTGIIGGPLHWEFLSDIGPFAFAQPTEIVVVTAWATLFLVVLHITHIRRRSKRAWLIPLWFLAADVLLLVAGRSGQPWPDLPLDYRYQTELAAATAVSLGLALFPLRGAREPVEIVRRSSFVDMPMRAGAVVVTVAALGTVSSIQYATHWQSAHQSRDYFARLDRELATRTTTLPLVAPALVAFLFPRAAHYPQVSTDSLYVIDQGGRFRPAAIPAVRQSLTGPDGPCGYRLRPGVPTRVPLNGPVLGIGWWLRIGYHAEEGGPVTVTFGDHRYQVRLQQGLHSVYLDASGTYSSVTISGGSAGTSGCVTDISVGTPQAVEAP